MGGQRLALAMSPHEDVDSVDGTTLHVTLLEGPPGSFESIRTTSFNHLFGEGDRIFYVRTL